LSYKHVFSLLLNIKPNRGPTTPTVISDISVSTPAMQKPSNYGMGGGGSKKKPQTARGGGAQPLQSPKDPKCNPVTHRREKQKPPGEKVPMYLCVNYRKSFRGSRSLYTQPSSPPAPEIVVRRLLWPSCRWWRRSCYSRHSSCAEQADVRITIISVSVRAGGGKAAF
jgi:hypothetical protein